MIVAGTGHRPVSMPCGYNEEHTWALEIKTRINNWLSLNKPKVVISGMAIGFDTWLAEEAINLGIEVHAYLPYLGQGNNWPKEASERYLNILCHPLVKIIYTSKDYSKASFHIRDRAMIDDADIILALWSGQTKGGTYETLEYCKKNYTKERINIWKDA